ncbi:MAG TPA: sodium/proline symporter PutP [Sediminispirochaeta sp.]|nr:sodium/proline symporter PutP [Sediminispirochaeta sp.]
MLYLQFGLYLALMLAVGYYYMKRTSNNNDFIIGGRTMGPVTTAISAGASDMSSWLLLGLPGAVFASGLVEGVWISLGLLLGAYFNWLIVAERLRTMTEKLDAVTLPSFIAKRSDDETGILKTVSTLVILFFFTLYVASGLKGGTLLFAHTFGASEATAMAITTLVVVSYTFLGGYMAVCWTDLLQGLLMLGALIFSSLLGFFAVSGSGAQISAANPAAFKFTTSFITGASLMAWGFGYFGQPHILARFIGIRNAESVKSARRVGITWMALSLVLATMIGIVGIGYNALFPLEGVAGPGGDSERIFLALTSALFHPLFSGFVLAAVLAAVMSTADSQLLVLTSSLTSDIPYIAKMDEKKKELISRLGVVGFAFIAYLISANDNGTILAMVGYAWGGFGAAFGPVVILALTWRRMTRWGALAGMLVGSITIYVVKNYISIEGEYFYELLPGFILAFLAIIVVSLLGDKPSHQGLEVFDETESLVRAK